jgi:branched-chain amino acid aminotransferase
MFGEEGVPAPAFDPRLIRIRRNQVTEDDIVDQEWQFSAPIHPNPTSSTAIAAALEHPGFGTVFSDHMVTVQWNEAEGWHDAAITARKPFQIDPAAAVLHYAQEIFEGLKAYKREDGTIALFRPDQNAKRFMKSAERLAMAPVPESLFLQAIEKLIEADKAWVPGGDGSLYIRPFQFASEVYLGVRPSHSYTFCVIASPVGAYFKGGSAAITVWVTDSYTRAAAGGTGAAKFGGNYANSLLAQAEATRHGCDQVVFLDAAEHRWVEELGGMNVFFVMDDGTLVTPPLAGTILPGITRLSLLDLAREQGLTVVERPYAFEQWREDAKAGRVAEAFACGTAAVISAIGAVRYAGGEFQIGDGGKGPVTQRLYDALTGIQRGTIPDSHGWVRRVV